MLRKANPRFSAWEESKPIPAFPIVARERPNARAFARERGTSEAQALSLIRQAESEKWKAHVARVARAREERARRISRWFAERQGQASAPQARAELPALLGVSWRQARDLLRAAGVKQTRDGGTGSGARVYYSLKHGGG